MSGVPQPLHSDNGSPMKGATLLELLYKLGITPSRSRPRVSNDNPYAESIFRTCKYRPGYPAKGFKDLDAARLWVLEFVRWYNGGADVFLDLTTRLGQDFVDILSGS